MRLWGRHRKAKPVTRKGIDIASYQHPNGEAIDWHQLAEDGFDWVAVKFTEGIRYVNPWAANDARDAKAAGFEVVAYHFARPTDGNGEDQAKWFQANLPGGDVIDGRALDLEDGRQLGLAALNEWCREFIAACPLNLVYYDESYRAALAQVGAPWGLHEWVADPSATSAPAGAAVWQSGQHPQAGVGALVDIDEVAYDRVSPAPASAPPQQSSLPDVRVTVPTLAPGSHGFPVKAVQALLRVAGENVNVDGDYGPATQAAVVSCQGRWGIHPSGEVDADTWARLILIG